MDLHTPEPETITVTDYDFVSTHGIVLALSLYPEDTISRLDTGNILVTVARVHEEYELQPEHLFYTRRTVRTVSAARPVPTLPTTPPSHAAIDSLQVFPVERSGRS